MIILTIKINEVIKMVQVITGEKGAGKTKKLISLANEMVSNSKGHIVYISNNSEHMFDLNSHIRLVDSSQFPISSIDSFIGFVFGIISEDYDIDTIFIDNVNNIFKDNFEQIEHFIKTIKFAEEKYGINFILGIRAPKDKEFNVEVEYLAV
jgi:predicted ATP-dependent serine protease